MLIGLDVTAALALAVPVQGFSGVLLLLSFLERRPGKRDPTTTFSERLLPLLLLLESCLDGVGLFAEFPGLLLLI